MSSSKTSAPSAMLVTDNRNERWAANGSVPQLEQYWQAVRNHWTVVSAIIALCLILAIIATLLMTPQYAAASRIEISRSQDNVTNVQGAQTDDAGQDLEFYQTQYSLLEARSLALRVSRSLKLSTNNEFFETLGVDIEGSGFLQETPNGRLDAKQRSSRMRKSVDVLLENVAIEPIRGSSLVDVKFVSPDRQLSAKVANEWVQQFINGTMDRRFSSTADARKFLEQRLNDLRAKLEESERQLVGYASNKAIVTLTSSTDASGRTSSEKTLISADLESLQNELAAAKAARIAAQSEAANFRGASKDQLSNSAINGLRERRAEVIAERAKLLSQFESGYPAVQALTAQINALDRSIGSEEARVRSGSSTGYAEAVAREKSLQNEVEKLKRRFIDQRRDTIQYNIFQREVDTNRQLYDGLLQRYKEIGIVGVGTNNIAVVDRAEPPQAPTSPSLPLNLALALLAGLGLSGAYIFGREQLDQSLKDPNDVTGILGLPLIGSLPLVDNDNIVDELADRKSIISEAYFSIGTSLSFLTDHGVPKSMLFTSTGPNEGKSTSAYAIAATLARTGKKVILVDADMRNPSLERFVDKKTDFGLSNFLAGEDDIGQLVNKTDRTGLWSVFSGPIPPSSTELLVSDRMQMLVEELGNNFDHVIVDSPPVLGIADIPLLANSAEGIVYVIEANRSKMRAIETALGRIRASNANLLGAVVTKLDQRNSPYGYGHSYGYGYGTSDKDS